MLNGNDLFLFGGRNNGDRLNDLYHLDMVTLRWTLLLANRVVRSLSGYPVGRTWHTLTKVSATRAIMYGGYDTQQRPLNDCWELDITPLRHRERPRRRWQRRLAFDRCPRLWHSATFESVTGQLWLIGGQKTDILGPADRKSCPKSVEKLTVAVPSLEFLAMRTAVLHQTRIDLRNEVKFLPRNLQPPIQHRLRPRLSREQLEIPAELEGVIGSYPVPESIPNAVLDADSSEQVFEIALGEDE